jgi:hypothetical protein
MKLIGLLFALIALFSGLVSAYYWYRASLVKIAPAWKLEIEGDREKNIMGWVTGNMIAFRESGILNKQAALWTAVTVLFGAISSLLGVLSSK